MRTARLRAPSPAMVVSIVALVVALGGTSYAAFTLPKNSVGTKQLKNGAVTTGKLHSGAVTASKINPAGLTVPNAGHAGSADSATNAANAATAVHATKADTATHADTAGHATTADTASALPGLTLTPLTLQNGWTGGPFNTRSPALAVDAQGVAHLEGAVAQTGTFNGNVFVVPAAARPAKDIYIHVDMCDAASGRIQVSAANGQAIIETGGGSTTSDAQCFTSLEGVTYPVG